MSEENLQTEEVIEHQEALDSASSNEPSVEDSEQKTEESSIEDAIKNLGISEDEGQKHDEDSGSDAGDGDESNKEEKPPENVENIEKEQKNEQKSDDRTDEQIAESLKSERGKARFHELLNEKATLEQEKKGFEEIVSGIRDTFEAAKLTPEDFAANIEFSRLRNSDNPNDVRLAYEMLEQERKQMAMRLGIVAPGIDYLKDHPDIAKAYEEGKIDDSYALELIRNRQYTQEIERSRQEQEQSYARQMQNQKAIDTSISQINAFLSSKKNEIDHAVKEKHVASILSDPAKVQELAATYEPHQWPSVIKMLYESAPAQAPQSQPVRRQQPISSRTAALGGGSVKGKTGEDIVSSAIDMLGL